MEETAESVETFETERPIAIALAVAEPKLRRLLMEALRDASIPSLDETCDTDRLESLLSSVERLQPEILFLGLPGLPVDSATVIARIATLDPAPRIVAVNDSAAPEIILKAMRAGAKEFVYPPFNAAAFDESLRRVIADCGRQARPERSSGSVIGFVSAKGGCGATTLACHTASHLRAITRKEILLADLDMASGITGTIMQTVARYSIDDAFQNLHRMDLKLWKGLVAASPSGVDVIGRSVRTGKAIRRIARFTAT